jgi:hypothetical protein
MLYSLVKEVFIMQTTQNNKSFKNTISILLLGTNIIMVISYIMITVSLLALIFGIIISKNFQSFSIEDVGGYIQTNISQSVKITFPLQGGEISLKQLSWTGGLLGLVYSSFLFLIIRKFKGILLELKLNRPFGEKSYLSLRVISYIFMAATIIIPIFEFIFFTQLINAVTFPEIDITFSLNLNYLWIGLILYVLAKVFEYGAFLQTSYDETV